MKIFVAGEDQSVRKMFEKRGHTIAKNFSDDFDLMCFTGGADITPLLYGQRLHKETHCDLSRDIREVGYWKHLAVDFPKVGICRGAQLGNVLCGGSLWQHVNAHNGGHHPIRIKNKNTEKPGIVNSAHHQMCRVTKNAEVLVTAGRSTRKEDDTQVVSILNPIQDYEDVEAFYYLEQDFLGVQWHPEWGHEPSERLFFELLDLYHTRHLDKGSVSTH